MPKAVNGEGVVIDPGHLFQRVYREMLLQICSDYPALPDPRGLSLSDIRFFYNGSRAALRDATAPKK